MALESLLKKRVMRVATTTDRMPPHRAEACTKNDPAPRRMAAAAPTQDPWKTPSSSGAAS